MGYIRDLKGQTFGQWLVIKRDAEKRKSYWRCRCSCGLIKSIRQFHLEHGNSLSCRKCSEHKHKGKLSSRVWARIVYRAKKKNLLVKLGKDVEESKLYLYDLLYKDQRGICALSGLPISIANTEDGDRRGESSASLDRINSENGYVTGNVQWVHKDVNKMKSDLEQAKFLELCAMITKRK